MSNLKILILVATMAMISACGEEPFCNCFEPTGGVTAETRPLSEFKKIEVFNNISVNIHRSANYLAVVRCGSKLLDGVTTTVVNGRLELKNINRCNWMRDPGNEFVVDLYVPELNEIVFRSAGDIRCADTISTNQFLAESWDGTGTMDLLLDCNETYLKIHTGPADINASGTTGYSYIYNTGNGYIRAGGLKAINATVVSRSTGDCYVHCSSTLNAKIQYIGDVYYSGQPTSIQKEITGAGKLIPL